MDPVDIPFAGRSQTVLRRHGFYDHWSLFDNLTEADDWDLGQMCFGRFGVQF